MSFFPKPMDLGAKKQAVVQADYIRELEVYLSKLVKKEEKTFDKLAASPRLSEQIILLSQLKAMQEIKKSLIEKWKFTLRGPDYYEMAINIMKPAVYQARFTR